MLGGLTNQLLVTAPDSPSIEEPADEWCEPNLACAPIANVIPRFGHRRSRQLALGHFDDSGSTAPRSDMDMSAQTALAKATAARGSSKATMQPSPVSLKNRPS
jgi:hypothetical protein